MSSKRAVVFANGEYDQVSASLASVTDEDFIVCVDGGVRHCLRTKLRPDLLLGDLDSLDEHSAAAIEQLGTEQIQYPAEKDASDLELALQALCERTVEQVVVLGVSGGRTDHQLFNWQLLASRAWPFQLRVIDSTIDAYLIHSSRPFDQPLAKGTTFSVIPLAGPATGVKVSGARYPLDDASLNPGNTIGLSNIVTDSRLQVSVEEGIVMLMRVLA